MENKMLENIVKYYLEILINERGVSEEEAYKMLNYSLQNEEVEQLIFQTMDDNLSEIF